VLVKAVRTNAIVSCLAGTPGPNDEELEQRTYLSVDCLELGQSTYSLVLNVVS